MTGTSVKLDLVLIDVNNPNIIGIGDMSVYPAGFNISSPSIQITPPGFNSVVLTFTPNSINLFNSLALGITCTGQDLVSLPDGLYTIKYTIAPAYTYYIEKTFMRVYNIQESLDGIFVGMDITQCDKEISDGLNRKINEIQRYIQFSIASANKCANIYAIEAYDKASRLIRKYNKSHCETC